MITLDDIEEIRLTRVGLCFAVSLLYIFTDYMYHSLPIYQMDVLHNNHTMFPHDLELICPIP